MPLVLSGTNGISSDGTNWALQPNSSGIARQPKIAAGRWFWNPGSSTATGLITSIGEIENNNSLFTVSAGKFYVPYAGWYLVTCHAIADPGGGYDARMLKNSTAGSSVAFLSDFRQQGNDTGKTHPGDSSTNISYYAAGDYFCIYILSSVGLYNGASTASPHNMCSAVFLG